MLPSLLNIIPHPILGEPAMKNVRNLLVAAVLAAVAACSGDATAPEAVQHPSRPSLETAAPDTTTATTGDPADGTQEDGEGRAPGSGLIGSSGG
jgi:hypothetical protein